MFKKIGNFLVFKFDTFVIKYLTVERGRNKRKWIWKTKQFREITQIYIPRCIFIGFIVIMCWKIHEKVKDNTKSELYYESKSIRQLKVEKETKVY
jgi:hypothetical protein